jgi:DNA-binding response OmpR family regulator
MHITETTPRGVPHLAPQLPLVLLVDDDPHDISLLREAFSEAEVRVRLMVAHDSKQAFGALRLVPNHSPPRLIILDLKLPGVRGQSVLREFTAHTAWSSVPMFILSSWVRFVDRVETMALGAAAYFVKPNSFEGYLQLAEALRKYVR